MQSRSPSRSLPSSLPADKPAPTAYQLVLRQARRLHRAANSDQVLFAMPSVRRAHAAGVLPGLALSELYHDRATLKRKHFLRTLAVEAGFADWETFRAQLERMSPDAFEHFKLADEGVAQLNVWFSDEAQAQVHADAHGGRVVRVGKQAVVVPVDAADGATT